MRSSSSPPSACNATCNGVGIGRGIAICIGRDGEVTASERRVPAGACVGSLCGCRNVVRIQGIVKLSRV